MYCTPFTRELCVERDGPFALPMAKRKGNVSLPLMHSYARIKPAFADKKGGVAASQSISGWNEDEGSVTIGSSVEGSKGKDRQFNHFQRTLPPDGTQEHTYSVMCAPLVEKWCDGYDIDIICYGQTGSGKTYTQFGPPHAMKEALDDLGETGGLGSISCEGLVRENHGFILRAGFEGLAAVAAVQDGYAVLHGSMVEFSIENAKTQYACDLLDRKKPCFVDKEHHLEGAKHVPLVDARSLVEMAAAVETRLTRGTKMNSASSRSHCITVFTLHVLDENGSVRISRLSFFDLMGSERFRGANAAHNTGASAHSTRAGAEGIFANYSLLFLGEAVRAAAAARRKKRGAITKMGGHGFLNELLAGSLVGNAMTAMITCLSPSPRNGAESLLSCKYSKDMSRMQNEPKRQPSVPIATIIETKKQKHEKSSEIVKKGVLGKYQAKRMAEVLGYLTSLEILSKLNGPSRIKKPT